MVPTGRLAGLFAVATLAACEPTFKPAGAISVRGAAFVPTECHVLLGATGIELRDVGGATLQLTLPPARLEAWQDLRGTPQARFDPGDGRPVVELGPCGTLVMTGEGHHADGKRSASGSMELDCKGGAVVSGSLQYSGCF